MDPSELMHDCCIEWSLGKTRIKFGLLAMLPVTLSCLLNGEGGYSLSCIQFLGNSAAAVHIFVLVGMEGVVWGGCMQCDKSHLMQLCLNRDIAVRSVA